MKSLVPVKKKLFSAKPAQPHWSDRIWFVDTNLIYEKVRVGVLYPNIQSLSEYFAEELFNS
jgi:hypothetical protein